MPQMGLFLRSSIVAHRLEIRGQEATSLTIAVVLNLWVSTLWSQITLSQGPPETIGKHR